MHALKSLKTTLSSIVSYVKTLVLSHLKALSMEIVFNAVTNFLLSPFRQNKQFNCVGCQKGLVYDISVALIPKKSGLFGGQRTRVKVCLLLICSDRLLLLRRLRHPTENPLRHPQIRE